MQASQQFTYGFLEADCKYPQTNKKKYPRGTTHNLQFSVAIIIVDSKISSCYSHICPYCFGRSRTHLPLGMDSNAGIPLTSASHVTESRSSKEQKLSPNQQQLNSKPNQVNYYKIYYSFIAQITFTIIGLHDRVSRIAYINGLLNSF
jgi:hypothetical protein